MNILYILVVSIDDMYFSKSRVYTDREFNDNSPSRSDTVYTPGFVQLNYVSSSSDTHVDDQTLIPSFNSRRIVPGNLDGRGRTDCTKCRMNFNNAWKKTNAILNGTQRVYLFNIWGTEALRIIQTDKFLHHASN